MLHPHSIPTFFFFATLKMKYCDVLHNSTYMQTIINTNLFTLDRYLINGIENKHFIHYVSLN